MDGPVRSLKLAHGMCKSVFLGSTPLAGLQKVKRENVNVILAYTIPCV